MSLLVFILTIGALLARAQDAPAATTVPPTDTSAGVQLFKAETVQLTDEVVATLNRSGNANVAEYAHLFAFDAPDSVARKRQRSGSCKSAPGDASWPCKIAWDVLDILLGGALSPIVPIASPCYTNSAYHDYDATKCAAIISGWTSENLHLSDPGSVMWPLYEGKTCMPGTNASALGTCTQGGYSAYSVRISNVAQIQLAINFARLSNLRLVIRNTGHDYNGRSTGKDALSLWTHNLKDIQFVKNYASPTYQGPAFKIGAGVQANELYKAADQNGVTTVAGICPTVGVAGGYITGGGHSPVMPLFGMGADQVLALEVVTANGRFVTATPGVNSDLYWAMLGGGGGTFGVITSAVLKAHPKIPVTTSTFSFNAFPIDPSVSEETFWKGFATLWDSFPAWNAAQTYSYFFVSNITGGMTFSMSPFFAPNKTVAEFEALIAPFLANLTALNIPYTINTTFHTSFLSAFDATFAPQDQHIGGASNIPGNRILPAENWNNATIRAQTLAAINTAVKNGLGLSIYHQAPAPQPKILNSVNPAFRNEASMVVAISLPAPDDQLGAAGRTLTNDVLGPLRAVSPHGGTYGNEAEINEPDFQKAFWGANYPRLLSIKNKWDPTGLFYVHHGVGSEEWVVQDGVKFGGIPTQNGRLCRA
ncbi:hypothetical protein BCR34DRAFT_576891 [Clohesyomyces aquaticus]|uniref:FAD-binding PCMH-type domain-containing protein n=1 Tax=Clohesyomyces aquaticus TaxID=1231657 RepID=A0A1Y1YLB9_9PLEO|nr:hypothetical protein BCR34DRAFT_576891 [Clohesyomyces aquaticus]